VHMFPATKFLMSSALSLACVLTSSAASAQAERGLQADTSGIVTNRAITVAGHEFFEYFIAAWREKPDSERYTLAILERPSARLGSQVRIEFAQRPVFQTRLPPSRAALKSLGENAADITYQAVLAANAQRVLVDDADLARDEL
jgi:curli production assembly/transport component CsgE